MKGWRLAAALVLAAEAMSVTSPPAVNAEPENVCSPSSDAGCQLVTAQAGPPPPGEPAPPSTAISWSELGLPDALTVTHSEKPQTVTVPIPDGFRPTRLIGQVEAVANAVNCRVDVFDGEHQYLGPISLAEEQSAGPFALDLATAVTGSEDIQLDFHLRQEGPPAELCSDEADGSTMQISRLAVEYSGEPAQPASVAEFLPDYLRHISVRVGSDPSTTVQQSALTLVAHLTHLYRSAPITIDVDTSDQPEPVTPNPLGTSRVIWIREDPKAGLSIVNPGTPESMLLVSGEGDALRRQVELFSDRRFEIAQADSTDVVDSARFAVRTGTVKTFGELKMTGQTTVTGSETMYLGFDAGQFGVGAIESAEIHLLAKYSPVIQGSGSAVLRAGPVVIATGILDQSGTVELKGRIPADVIQSNVGLGLELRYLPPGADLVPSDGITFAIQPESTIEVHPGTQTRRGFSVLPMAFVPEFNVAVSEPDKIKYAAAAINLMGQNTSVALRPRLVSVEEGVGSTSGLLIVTSTTDLARLGLQLPLIGEPDGGTAMSGNPAVDVELNGPRGIIETSTDPDNRTVLAIAAATDWGLVQKSFDYIRSLDGQWGALSGDVVATGAQGESVNLAIDQGDSWQDLYPGERWGHWAAVSFGTAALLLFAGAMVWFLRRRGSRPAPEADPPS